MFLQGCSSGEDILIGKKREEVVQSIGHYSRTASLRDRGRSKDAWVGGHPSGSIRKGDIILVIVINTQTLCFWSLKNRKCFLTTLPFCAPLPNTRCSCRPQALFEPILNDFLATVSGNSCQCHQNICVSKSNNSLSVFTWTACSFHTVDHLPPLHTFSSEGVRDPSCSGISLYPHLSLLFKSLSWSSGYK